MDELELTIPEQEEQFTAENVVVDSSVVLKVSASQDADVRDSVVGVLAAGDNLNTSGSVGSAFVAGGDLHLQEGAGGLMVVGGNATLDHSKVGLLVGGNDVSLAGDSQVIVTLPVAITFALVTGVALGLVTYLLKGRKG